MYLKINNNACPHCGAVYSQTPDTWLNNMDGGEPLRCLSCKKSFDENQASPELLNKERANWNFNISFFIIVFILLALMIYLNRTFSVLTLKEDSGQIVYEILFIIIISSSVASGKIRQNLKYLAIWAGIFLIMITGYSYRHELTGIKDKVIAEIIPSRGLRKEQNSISFPVSSDGHFHIRAEVNGIPVIFLADTGASHIVLSPADATKIGINTDELRFDRFYETANGTVRGSSVQIDDLQIGEFRLKEIWASVNEAEMQGSLLGMTFFKRLKRYEVKNDVLTLYWSE